MEEEFLNIKEYSLLTGKTRNSLYAQRTRDKKNSQNLKRYKRIGGKIHYSTKEYYAQKELQKKFEDLYYSIIGDFKNEYSFAKELTRYLDKSPNTILMYFTDCFFTKAGSRKKKDYVLAMEKYVYSKKLEVKN